MRPNKSIVRSAACCWRRRLSPAGLFTLRSPSKQLNWGGLSGPGLSQKKWANSIMSRFIRWVPLVLGVSAGPPTTVLGHTTLADRNEARRDVEDRRILFDSKIITIITPIKGYYLSQAVERGWGWGGAFPLNYTAGEDQHTAGDVIAMPQHVHTLPSKPSLIPWGISDRFFRDLRSSRRSSEFSDVRSRWSIWRIIRDRIISLAICRSFGGA
ncbi:hypothetical protein J6590_046710 [Homalodisca vitripennis]|nr:hypothetical protein J6590_046710 [Homalodisca vitripennis]